MRPWHRSRAWEAGLALALAATAGPARGEIAFVQVTGYDCQGTCQPGDAGFSTLSVPFSSPSVAGNTIVMGVNWSPANAPPPHLSDNAGNTYQIAVGPIAGVTGFDFTSLMAYAAGIDGGPLVATLVTPDSGLTFLELIAAEYSGVDLAAPLDGATGREGPGPVSTPPLVTTSPGDYLVAVAFVAACVGDAGAGFVWREQVVCDGLEDGPAEVAGTYQASVGGNPQGTIMVTALRSAAASRAASLRVGCDSSRVPTFGAATLTGALLFLLRARRRWRA